LGPLNGRQQRFYDGRKLDVPEPIPVHDFLVEVLHGMGQIVFCKSTLTGTFVTAGLFLVSPGLATTSLLGCMTSTGFAKLSGAQQVSVHAGFTGYSGALLGCALFAFFPADPFTLALATISGSVVTSFVASGLGRISPAPQLPIAFNLIALAVLLIIHPLAPPGVGKIEEPIGESVDPLGQLVAVFTGISQMCFMNNPGAGFLIFTGIFCCSPVAAGLAALGSMLGSFTAGFLGADAYEIDDGIWGYNGALTALAIASYYVNSGPLFWAFACGGAIVSTLLMAKMKTLGENHQTPPLSLPFCATALGCILFGYFMPGRVCLR